MPIPPLAERYDRLHGLRRGETIFVISISGKNASPIEGVRRLLLKMK